MFTSVHNDFASPNNYCCWVTRCPNNDAGSSSAGTQIKIMPPSVFDAIPIKSPQNQIIFGRNHALIYNVPVDEISDNHCQVASGTNGSLIFRDLNSTNGTQASIFAFKGDTIQIENKLDDLALLFSCKGDTFVEHLKKMYGDLRRGQSLSIAAQIKPDGSVTYAIASDGKKTPEDFDIPLFTITKPNDEKGKISLEVLSNSSNTDLFGIPLHRLSTKSLETSAPIVLKLANNRDCQFRFNFPESKYDS
jgi:hypothetical protein